MDYASTFACNSTPLQGFGILYSQWAVELSIQRATTIAIDCCVHISVARTLPLLCCVLWRLQSGVPFIIVLAILPRLIVESSSSPLLLEIDYHFWHEPMHCLCVCLWFDARLNLLFIHESEMNHSSLHIPTTVLTITTAACGNTTPTIRVFIAHTLVVVPWLQLISLYVYNLLRKHL